MIVRSEQVFQSVDGETRRAFVKDVITVAGPEPLAMVRKRLPAETRPTADPPHPPLLLTHGFGQNRYSWHLPSRSFVNHLAAHGHDVFNLDLRGHGRSRALGARSARGVAAYVYEDLPAAIDEVRALTGAPRVLLVGHSLGAIVSCLATPLRHAAVAGVVALGPPYRFARGSRTLGAFAHAMEGLSRLGLMPGVRGVVPVRLVGAALRRTRLAWDAASLPIPVRAWHPGSMEPHVVRELLDRSFDRASVGTLLEMTALGVQGEFPAFDGIDGLARDFEHLVDVPLLVVAGAHDLLAPPSSVRPLYDRSRAHDRTYRVVPFGHADMLVGREAPARVWPLVTDWLDRHR